MPPETDQPEVEVEVDPRSDPDSIENQAERRRGLERRLHEQYIDHPTDHRPLAETDATIEEGIAAGLYTREEGVPDEHFPGDRVVPGNARAETILNAARANRRENIRDQLRGGTKSALRREFMSLPARLPADGDPEVFINDLARRGREMGVFKEVTGRSARPDGLFAGNRYAGTSPEATTLLDSLRLRARDLVSDRETDRLNNVIGPADPDDYGLTFATLVEHGIRDGKIDVVPHYPAGGPKKGVQPDRYDIRPLSDKAAAEISTIYAGVYNAEVARSLADPDQLNNFNNRMLQLMPKFDSLRAQGENHRQELADGVDTSVTDDARRRIEALNTEDERWAPVTDRAEVRRLNLARRAAQQAGGLIDPATHREDMNAVLNAAYGEDSAAAEGGRIHNEFQPRIDALQLQIDGTTDRAMRAGLESSMATLVAERGTAARAAENAQGERTRQDAAWMARDPAGYAREVAERAAVEPRRATFRTWAENPTMLTGYATSNNRQWPDIDGGPWNQMTQVQRDAATPLLDQAYQVFTAPMPGGAPPDMDRVNALRNQAFEATERVRVEQAAKTNRIHASNDAAELQVVTASRNNETSAPINLGRSDVSPELNNEIVNDARRRFHMAETPTAVRARVGQNSEGQRVDVRDLIYQSPDMPNVALVARYDRAGRMLSADLIAVQDGAFRGRRGDRPSGRLSDALDDSNNRGGPQATVTSYDTPEQAVEGGGSGDSSDWSGYDSPNVRRARARDLARTGMRAPAADIVARRGPAVRRPNRGSGFFQLFGR